MLGCTGMSEKAPQPSLSPTCHSYGFCTASYSASNRSASPAAKAEAKAARIQSRFAPRRSRRCQPDRRGVAKALTTARWLSNWGSHITKSLQRSQLETVAEEVWSINPVVSLLRGRWLGCLKDKSTCLAKRTSREFSVWRQTLCTTRSRRARLYDISRFSPKFSIDPRCMISLTATSHLT